MTDEGLSSSKRRGGGEAGRRNTYKTAAERLIAGGGSPGNDELQEAGLEAPLLEARSRGRCRRRGGRRWRWPAAAARQRSWRAEGGNGALTTVFGRDRARAAQEASPGGAGGRDNAAAASCKEDDGGSRGPPDRDEEEGAHREEDEWVEGEKGAARER